VAQLLEHGLNPTAETQPPAGFTVDNSGPRPPGATENGSSTNPSEHPAVC